MRLLLSLLLVLLIVPGWTGEERLALPEQPVAITAARVALHPGDPAVRQAGRLRFLGGVALASADEAWGGFSALSVQGDRFALLSDGGNLLRFRMGNDWRPRAVRFGPLPAGPDTGWRKADRDSESVAVDPRTGDIWVGFENSNAIWRYRPEFAGGVRGRAPPAMADWLDGGGAEAMLRLRDGRFVVIAEYFYLAPMVRHGLIFPGDPTAPGTPSGTFGYRPERGMDPVDMAELPDGRVLVLERGFNVPFRWSNRLAVVERGAIRPGAIVTGRTVARLADPLIHDNFEGVAVTEEGGATIVWLLSDDNQNRWQRTLLLKFRLDA